MIKLIGYWIESLEDPHYAPPQELVGNWDPELQQQVADYLDAGVEFRQYRQRSWCRFFCDHAMNTGELTDGTWAWPVDLSHYVRDHSVQLPDEFVRHVQSKPTAPEKSLAWYAASPDLTFWQAWSQRQANGKFRAALEMARQEADRMLTSAANDVERQLGNSAKECKTDNCPNLAVTDRPNCARCLVERNRHLHVGTLYTNLRPILAPDSSASD